MTRRGFTLVEILIAASVLGLGVLGIATLFAGAARQQQIASDQTESNRVARNIDARLADRFQRFGGMALDDDTTLIGEPFFARGQWHPLAAAPAGGVVSGALDSALLLDLSDDGLGNQTAFGLAEAGGVILYRAPWQNPDDVPAFAWNTGSRGANPGLPKTLSDLINTQANGALLRPAPYGRLQPGFRIIVVLDHEQSPMGLNPNFTFGSVDDTIEFTFANWQSLDVLQADPELWPADPDPPEGDNMMALLGEQSERIIELVAPSEDIAGAGQVDPPGGTSPSDDSWIRVRVQQPGSGDPPIARLDDLKINMPDNTSDGERWLIREIRLEDVTYREDRLLSLSERLSYRDDDAFPGGRRPARGVAVLFRRTLDGRDQLMSLPYTLEPLARVEFDQDTELPFVPPDTFDRLYDTTNDPASHGLLSQVELELGYDPNIERYVLTAKTETDNWAVEKDQRIVVSTADPDGGSVSRTDPSSPNAGRGDDPLPGADAPVRVLFNRTDPTGRLQGVLSDSPRVSPPRGGPRSMLPDIDDTVDIWAWALRPIVRGERGGDRDTEWRVRPTGAQTVTLGGAQ